MPELQIPNNTEWLFVLQAFVVESAKVFHLPNNMLERLKLVSEEAFLHVLKNSFAPGESSHIRVTTKVSGLHFKLSFFDKGLPFDSSLAKEYHPDAGISNMDTEGMELFLIRQFVDQVEWLNHGYKGKEFRLSLELPKKDIFTILKGKNGKSEEAVTNIDHVEIRTFKAADAIKIARTIYRAYGYTYPNEELYYPEKIANLNKSGRLISVVCYDKKRDEVIGHYALERPALGSIAESGQAVVSPGYRGFHLMDKMRNILEEKARELQLEGIMSQPVTTHVFSQKVNANFGSLPCGFSFGLVPQKLSFRKIDTTLSQRESCMLYFKPMKSRKRVLSLPDQHKDIIASIYHHLGIRYQKMNTVLTDSDKNGKVQSNFYASWGFGVIEVLDTGKNNFFEIKQALYNLLFTLKADVIFLNIPLEEADISPLVERVEKEKFFFCGIMPSLLNGRDVVRFEYLNGTIDASKIKILGNEAKEIFSYILNEKEKALR
jgi:anti-sigma regulatory factor (Ser/Thr protein kinase)